MVLYFEIRKFILLTVSLTVFFFFYIFYSFSKKANTFYKNDNCYSTSFQIQYNDCYLIIAQKVLLFRSKRCLSPLYKRLKVCIKHSAHGDWRTKTQIKLAEWLAKSLGISIPSFKKKDRKSEGKKNEWWPRGNGARNIIVWYGPWWPL